MTSHAGVAEQACKAPISQEICTSAERSSPSTRDMDLDHGLNTILIGRERERQRLYEGWQSGRPMLVCGPRGMGKSRLLTALKAELESEGAPVCYVRFVQPLHEFLKALSEAIRPRKDKDMTAGTSIALRGILWKELEEHPRTILLDDIADAGPHSYRFFERALAATGVTMVGAAAHQYALGSLHRLFWDQRDLISLKRLGGSQSLQLADSAIRAFNPDIPGIPVFRNQVLKAARGNPGRIIRMCQLAAQPAYRNGERIRFAALCIDSLTSQIS